VILNTSFNAKEPIVASPKDAISCYLRSGIDVLAIGNFLSVISSSGHVNARQEEHVLTPA
jgi:carbamoyltransferase